MHCDWWTDEHAAKSGCRRHCIRCWHSLQELAHSLSSTSSPQLISFDWIKPVEYFSFCWMFNLVWAIKIENWTNGFIRCNFFIFFFVVEHREFEFRWCCWVGSTTGWIRQRLRWCWGNTGWLHSRLTELPLDWKESSTFAGCWADSLRWKLNMFFLCVCGEQKNTTARMVCYCSLNEYNWIKTNPADSR